MPVFIKVNGFDGTGGRSHPPLRRRSRARPELFASGRIAECCGHRLQGNLKGPQAPTQHEQRSPFDVIHDITPFEQPSADFSLIAERQSDGTQQRSALVSPSKFGSDPPKLSRHIPTIIMSDTPTDPELSAAASQPDAPVIWSASEGQVDNFGYFALCIAFCWLLVPLLTMAARYVRTALHHYELTPQRLRERTGIFSRHIDELELYRVKDIAVEQPVIQRMLRRGRIVLQTSDRSSPKVTLNCIPLPREVAHMLREQVERCRVMKGVREID